MKLCLTLAFVFGASASGADFSLNPSADAFVSAANPTINYGAAGALSVAASGSMKGEFDSLLRFDFAPAAASFDSMFGAGLWSIDSIKLRLTAAVPANQIFNGSAAGSFAIQWMQNDSWTEGSGTPLIPTTTGITFSTLSTFRSSADEALGTFSFNGATSGNNEWNLALAPAFTADAAAGALVSFLMLPADATIGYTSFGRNFTTPASRPVLMVSALPVPEPGTGALLALAAAGWLTRRARQR